MTAHSGVRWPPLRGVLCVLIAAVVLLTGCSALADLQFRQDDRLRIVLPQNLSTVRLPITVSWEMTGFTPASSGPPSSSHGRFAVFLDRYPMPPGKSLRSLVDSDPGCRGTDACLQPTHLGAVFGIHVTTETSVTIDRLPSKQQPGTGDSGHYATIVLLDTADNRIGESVWYVSFRIAS
jgi:hypothetical protein